MKIPLIRYFCIDKECDWEEVSHRLRDSLKCPKCGLPTSDERVKKSGDRK
ncbi:hypothetical protein ACDI16_02455 [Oceanobacillus caeni]